MAKKHGGCMKIEIRNRLDNKIILCGEYEGIKDCLEKNKGADLGGANLRGADLRDADLGDAFLGDADLGGAKNYFTSHDFALEIIRRQDIKHFSDKEWAIIGKISVHKICWEEITQHYKSALSIFKKLEKLGYGEYLNKFQG